MRKHLISLFALVGLIVLVGLVRPLYLRSSSEDLVSDKPLQVQTIKTRQEVLPLWLETVAPLHAKQHIHLQNQIQGQVEKILEKEGGYVNQGTPLLRLKPDFIVKAPISGFLSDWKITAGEHINIGTPLVDIINKSQVIATYSVPESYAPDLKVGQKVYLTFRAFKDEVFEGEVIFVAPEVSKEDHSIHVKAVIPNPSHQLLPGMFAHIKHLLQEKKDALVVPESAVVRKISGYEVFVVKENKAKRQTVQVGQRLLGKIHITQGLTLDDEVVIAIPPTLHDGKSIIATPFNEVW